MRGVGALGLRFRGLGVYGFMGLGVQGFRGVGVELLGFRASGSSGV